MNPESSIPADRRRLPYLLDGQSVLVLERFESAWRIAASSGGRPRIEEYLVTIPEHARTDFFCRLLAAELKCREQAGEFPDPQEYVSQYPDAADLVKSVFQQSKSGNHLKNQSGAAFTNLEATGEYRASMVRDAVVLDGESGFGTPSTIHRGRPSSFRQFLSQVLPEVPGYEVLEVLGRGGMGIVYKARHLQLQRLVALKMILPGRELSPGILERFLNEAWVVARFQHPHIVQIHDIGEYDGLPYLSLELLDGGSLNRKLEEATLPALEAAALLETLSHAVEYAHQKDIVHRDLKPANVLFAADGTPRITDFGIAKYLDDKEGQTEDGGILGTPSYMAPEQASGENAVVGRSADIYALGAVLYEMLTGRPPFKAPDKWQTIGLVRTQEPVPPRHLAPEVPRDLELICLKCLSKDPRQRFASALELAEELSRFRQGRPILTRPTPSWERAWKWAKRKPAIASLAAVSAVTLLSWVLYLDQRANAARRDLGEQAICKRPWKSFMRNRP